MAEKNPELLASKVIKALRKKKLSQGIPFMINSDILEPYQCFLEYPDGSIKIAEADSTRCDFKIVFEYDTKDLQWLRKKLGVM